MRVSHFKSEIAQQELSDSSGGEGGIRTLGALRLTRSPGARVRPDYATSPIRQTVRAVRRPSVGVRDYTRPWGFMATT